MNDECSQGQHQGSGSFCTRCGQPITDVRTVLQGLEGVDAKLLAHPAFAHLPSVLEEGELPASVAWDAQTDVYVATDRRVIHLKTTLTQKSIGKVTSYPYSDIRSFQAETGFLSIGCNMETTSGARKLPMKPETRGHFVTTVQSHLQVASQGEDNTPQGRIGHALENYKKTDDRLQQFLENDKKVSEDKKQWKRIDESRSKVGLEATVRSLSLEGPWLEGAKRRQEIDDQWDSVTPLIWGNRHSGERQMLYDIMDSDEAIARIVGGMFRQDTDRLRRHKGVAVATNKRVIFADKGLLGSTEVMEMPYRSIEAITYSTGMFMGGIQITGRGVASFRIEEVVEKDTLQPFSDCVRSLCQETQQVQQTTSAPSSVDDLEKLAGLLERGFLTQEEFDAKKKELLGL